MYKIPLFYKYSDVIFGNMPEQLKLISNKGFLHKIAVLCKDFYVNRTIHDLFIYAGADHAWWKPANDDDILGSFNLSRESNVYLWIEGIQKFAPNQVEHILEGVAVQLIENENIPQGDRQFLARALGGNPILQPSAVDHLSEKVAIPDDIEQLLEILIKGLPRAMFPLKYRRDGLPQFNFDNEYDVQSLLHSLLRIWVKDIRVEEYTPSYAGSSTRIDFLLTHYGILCEIKYVRDKRHASKIGDEIIIDTAHYKAHPQCKQLWVAIYDHSSLISNPTGLIKDLQKLSESMIVKTFIMTS